MNTNKEEISFRFNKKDKKLFEKIQKEHWHRIEVEYKNLRSKCIKEIFVPIEATHKEWITARVRLHINESVMRLLFLTEAFCETSKKFNGAASAVLVKGMVEIPLHMGYLLWIITKKDSFEKIKEHLTKVAFGNTDQTTGLTYKSKVSGKDLYQKADEMIKSIFKEESQKSTINIFETLYKEANATGHHNYEARMFCGLQNKGIWKAEDRKKMFLFCTNKIFQLFFHCDAVLGMTNIFWDAIEHHLEQLPDYIENK